MNKITPKDEILSYWAKYNKVRLLKHDKTLVDISIYSTVKLTCIFTVWFKLQRP